jgi:hypothetical protein
MKINHEGHEGHEEEKDKKIKKRKQYRFPTQWGFVPFVSFVVKVF